MVVMLFGLSLKTVHCKYHLGSIIGFSTPALFCVPWPTHTLNLPAKSDPLSEYDLIGRFLCAVMRDLAILNSKNLQCDSFIAEHKCQWLSVWFYNFNESLISMIVDRLNYIFNYFFFLLTNVLYA